MEIPDLHAPILVMTLRDAISNQKRLIDANLDGDVEDYEEYLLQLTQLFDHVKDEYRKIADDVGVPLEVLLDEH
ncbi:hypothetical protein CCU68_04090 [Pseudomonas gingeri NCPPB 3146 = LMG 5327]|uniref:Uncharacterized protein n=2 Tax=Pseudomonas gingeri TaxID=117681 RepID=A0A7Y8CFK1_9PSED|nr:MULTISPECIES: hypothetical protein [Pseudomonas]NVZ25756.1 hypothetical protein [Pseudomonas gingeri]NWA06331.1 hypothetical protein [Pseudomonas gingeri]NWC17009.1 hypothetical protein [Pseudomonas gingeri]NWE45792.1 hypothetical protein [Pseudomonas gingeri]NWE68117.1 hypothetical protein [Pseudomonas gingeri]